MTFFYDINKKLADIANRVDSKPISEGAMAEIAHDTGKRLLSKSERSSLAQQARAGQDIGKPGKKFADVAQQAGGGIKGKKIAAAAMFKGAAKRMHEDEVEEGNPYAYSVIKAKQAGAKPGDKIDGPGGQDITIKEKMSPERAKSFAALAPPKDKITFADKIAGAKKEVDEMLGDVAAEAMRNAIGKKVVADEGWEDMVKYVKDRDLRTGEKRKTSKGEVEKTATGVIHRRSYDPKTGETDTGDDSPAAGEKRGRGRPKGTGGPRQERVTAKSRKQDRTAHGQSGFKKADGKKKVKEDDFIPGHDQGEYDREGEMAKQDLKTAKDAAAELRSILDSDENLPEWVQSKITKAVDYLDTARDYMQSKDDGDEEPVAEKAVSKKQQKFMGMVHAAQKGAKPASAEVAKVAKTMKKSDAKDFAATKHEGLPEKKKKKAEESTVAGSVAPVEESPKPKKGGVQFGKGVYESLDRQLKQALNEEMSVNVSVSTQGGKTINVTATEDDAEKLAEILNLAGLGGQSQSESSCPVCNSAPCGCSEQVDENAPDYPENMGQTADTKFMTKTLAGGLNKEKWTGQTTTPVIASQLYRQKAYEDVELERSLFKLYQEVKSK